MNQETRTLGVKLRELREDFDLSQNQIASALNIDRSTYSNYELDKTRPTLEALVKLAHIFRVPKESLLPEDEQDEGASCLDAPQPGSIDRSMNKDERGMLVLYRSLSREQRAQIREQMLRMTKPGSLPDPAEH